MFMPEFSNAAKVTSLQSEGRVQPPKQILCPITKKIYFEPMFASDGFTYEKQAISAATQEVSPLIPN